MQLANSGSEVQFILEGIHVCPDYVQYYATYNTP